MRTLIGTFLVGVSLLASPALAQQHPRVHSGLASAGRLPISGAHAQAHSRIHKGDIVESTGRRAGEPAKDELYNSCYTSHPVFSCPGTM